MRVSGLSGRVGRPSSEGRTTQRTYRIEVLLRGSVTSRPTYRLSRVVEGIGGGLFASDFRLFVASCESSRSEERSRVCQSCVSSNNTTYFFLWVFLY